MGKRNFLNPPELLVDMCMPVAKFFACLWGCAICGWGRDVTQLLNKREREEKTLNKRKERKKTLKSFRKGWISFDLSLLFFLEQYALATFYNGRYLYILNINE